MGEAKWPTVAEGRVTKETDLEHNEAERTAPVGVDSAKEPHKLPPQDARRRIMANLGDTWNEVTEAAGATEAAARTYQQMVRRWIIADLGSSWGCSRGASSLAFED